MSERLLTVEEFAARTQQHAQTVRRHIRRGDVPTVRTGRKYLIPESLALPVPRSVPAAPDLAAPAFDLAALFKPPTPAEIARRLAALESIGQGIERDPDAPELDLSGDRGTVYGYTERENAQV